MAFQTVYEQTKSLAQSFRQTLMNALVTERFNKMLQAMIDSVNIANSALNAINIEPRKFMLLDNISGVVLPAGLTVDLTDSNIPNIKASWTGSKITKTVNNEQVRLIPISEITYEPQNIADFKADVSYKLNRMAVVISVPFTDPNNPPTDADFHDYRNAYYLPKSVSASPLVNAKYGVYSPTEVDLFLDWKSLAMELEADKCTLEYVVGQLIRYNFGTIRGVTNVEFDVWFNPTARFKTTGAGGKTVYVNITADVIIYHYKVLPNGSLRIADYPAFSCSNNDGMYMLAPTYTTYTGWVFLGYSPMSVG